jgi:predicted ATPase
MPSLWHYVTWVFDSRHPDELYKNGLQRGSFEPCIDMIKNKFQVIDLDSKTGKSPWTVFLSSSAFDASEGIDEKLNMLMA